jgi:hypothetical protein
LAAAVLVFAIFLFAIFLVAAMICGTSGRPVNRCAADRIVTPGKS